MSQPGNNTPVVAGPPIPPPQAFLSLIQGRGEPSTWMFQWMQAVYAALVGQGGIIEQVDLQAPSSGTSLALAEGLMAASAERAYAPPDPGGQFSSLEDRITNVEAFQAQQRSYLQASPSMVPWTPTIIGSTTPGAQTYTVQWGGYMVMGPAILALFNVSLSAVGGTIAGNVALGGFPFPAVFNATIQPQFGWTRFGNVTLAGGYTQINPFLAAGNSTALFSQSGSASAPATLPVTALSATSVFSGGMVYFR